MCAGLAAWLDLDPTLVRIVVILATLVTGGLAALVYLVLWAAMPLPATDDGGRDRRPGGYGRLKSKVPPDPAARIPNGSWAVGAGSGFIVLGLLFIFREAGVWWSDTLVWPLVLVAVGTALIWRQLSSGAVDGESSREHSRSRLGPFRGGLGIALLLGGGLLFLYFNGALEAGGRAALALLTAVIVIGLIVAPIWARSARDLSAERAERIRSEERAEVAAHLHDSVLQTLALIQQNREDPRRVSTLARSQERELRDWLSGKSESDRADSLADSLKTVAAEIEQRHEVPIEVVTVGDRALDEQAMALVAATREAMTNAARHSETSEPVRLYAEIEPERVEVFVRDRGRGFDPAQIPADRRGVRNSILGRMESNGGRAEVRSVPGEGTEVELVLESE